MTSTLIRIAVTAADIDNGVVGSCSECALALAAERAMPGATVEIGSDVVEHGIVFTRPDETRVARIAAPHVREFVVNFDEDGLRHLCDPFVFDLELRPVDPPARPTAAAAAAVVLAAALTALGAVDAAAQEAERPIEELRTEELTPEERARRGAALRAFAFELTGVTPEEAAALTPEADAAREEPAEPAEPAEPTRGEMAKQEAADCAVRGAIGAIEALTWGRPDRAARAATWECRRAVGGAFGRLFRR